MERDCTFCRIARGELSSSIVLESAETIAFLDHRPLFPGHCLLVPRAHVETLEELPRALAEPLLWSARRIARALERALAADGAFVALNHRVSQSVAHLHLHVVPRRRGDGLRGFFWPRRKYASDAEREATAGAIRTALEALPD